MKIGLLGFSDKRHVIFSFLRFLGPSGKTILLTPNKQYVGLSKEHTTNFEISDITVIVYEGQIDELEEDPDIDLGSYSYVIYDCLDDIPMELDNIIIFDDRDYYVKELEDRGMEEGNIFTNMAVKKEFLSLNEKTVKIPPASQIEEQLLAVNRERVLKPIGNKLFIRTMASLLSPVTGVSVGDIFARLRTGVINL